MNTMSCAESRPDLDTGRYLTPLGCADRLQPDHSGLDTGSVVLPVNHPDLSWLWLIFGAFQCNFTTFYIRFSGQSGQASYPMSFLMSFLVRWLLVTGSTFINFAQVRVVRSRVVDSRPSSLVGNKGGCIYYVV